MLGRVVFIPFWCLLAMLSLFENIRFFVQTVCRQVGLKKVHYWLVTGNWLVGCIRILVCYVVCFVYNWSKIPVCLDVRYLDWFDVLVTYYGLKGRNELHAFAVKDPGIEINQSTVQCACGPCNVVIRPVHWQLTVGLNTVALSMNKSWIVERNSISGSYWSLQKGVGSCRVWCATDSIELNRMMEWNWKPNASTPKIKDSPTLLGKFQNLRRSLCRCRCA